MIIKVIAIRTLDTVDHDAMRSIESNYIRPDGKLPSDISTFVNYHLTHYCTIQIERQ